MCVKVAAVVVTEETGKENWRRVSGKDSETGERLAERMSEERLAQKMGDERLLKRMRD